MLVLPREEREREEIEGDGGGRPTGDYRHRRHLPEAAKQQTSSCTSPFCQSSHTPLSHRSGKNFLCLEDAPSKSPQRKLLASIFCVVTMCLHLVEDQVEILMEHRSSVLMFYLFATIELTCVG
ncbi:unnamed protein product [Camellia sinensis]